MTDAVFSIYLSKGDIASPSQSHFLLENQWIKTFVSSGLIETVADSIIWKRVGLTHDLAPNRTDTTIDPNPRASGHVIAALTGHSIGAAHSCPSTDSSESLIVSATIPDLRSQKGTKKILCRHPKTHFACHPRSRFRGSDDPHLPKVLRRGFNWVQCPILFPNLRGKFRR
jgi:hypothetical protein